MLKKPGSGEEARSKKIGFALRKSHLFCARIYRPSFRENRVYKNSLDKGKKPVLWIRILIHFLLMHEVMSGSTIAHGSGPTYNVKKQLAIRLENAPKK
jgi:hypothetical protein